MSKVIVHNSVTLDGVMQAPARADEDLRDGFEHGGWAQPYFDEATISGVSAGIAQDGDLLLGRQTYEDFASVWPHMPEENPFTAVMNNFRKHVASTTLEEPLAWNNSTLLKGDAVEAVTKLKEQLNNDLVILGSGGLVQSLMQHNLIDRYELLIHPLVLGSGRRFFPDGGASVPLRLVDTKTTTTGVVVATYEPAGATA